MTVISFTSDFGTRDGFVGIVKGVMLGIAAQAQIVDISHEVGAQQIRAGAYLLWRAYRFFPSGTIHLYVIDPGVGTERRALAARIGDHYFVGPDNGVLSAILQDAARDAKPTEFIHLNDPKFWLPRVSTTFHGRDIFGPCAAHLANGTPLHDLGAPISDPARLELSQSMPSGDNWNAHVTSIDIYGNIRLDLPASALRGRTDWRVRLRGAEIHGLVSTFGSRPPGELIALLDSMDQLEIAEVNGNAAARLQAQVGDLVEVIYSG